MAPTQCCCIATKLHRRRSTQFCFYQVTNVKAGTARWCFSPLIFRLWPGSHACAAGFVTGDCEQIDQGSPKSSRQARLVVSFSFCIFFFCLITCLGSLLSLQTHCRRPVCHATDEKENCRSEVRQARFFITGCCLKRFKSAGCAASGWTLTARTWRPCVPTSCRIRVCGLNLGLEPRDA